MLSLKKSSHSWSCLVNFFKEKNNDSSKGHACRILLVDKITGSTLVDTSGEAFVDITPNSKGVLKIKGSDETNSLKTYPSDTYEFQYDNNVHTIYWENEEGILYLTHEKKNGKCDSHTYQ